MTKFLKVLKKTITFHIQCVKLINRLHIQQYIQSSD